VLGLGHDRLDGVPVANAQNEVFGVEIESDERCTRRGSLVSTDGSGGTLRCTSETRGSALTVVRP